MNNYIPVLHNLLEESRKKSDGDQIFINRIPFQKMMFQTQKEIAQIFPNVKCISINNCDLRTLENFPFLKNLQSLDVSNNSLQGSFQFLIKNKKLQYINAAHNYISNLEKLAPLRNLKGLSLYINQNTICEKEGFALKIRQYSIKLLKQPKVLIQQAKAINLVKDQNQTIEVKQKKEAFLDRSQIEERIREMQQQRRNIRQKQKQLLQIRRNRQRQLVVPQDREREQQNFRQRWRRIISIEADQQRVRSPRFLQQFLRPPRMRASIPNGTERTNLNNNLPTVSNGTVSRLAGRSTDILALRQDLAQIRRFQMNSTERNGNNVSPSWISFQRGRQGLLSLIQNSSSESNLNNANRNINRQQRQQSSESQSQSIKQQSQNEQDDNNENEDHDGNDENEDEDEAEAENQDLLQNPQENLLNEDQESVQEEQQEYRQEQMLFFVERPDNIFEIDNMFNIDDNEFIISDRNHRRSDRSMPREQPLDNIYNIFDREQNYSLNDQPQDQEPQQ